MVCLSYMRCPSFLPSSTLSLCMYLGMKYMLTLLSLPFSSFCLLFLSPPHSGSPVFHYASLSQTRSLNSLDLPAPLFGRNLGLPAWPCPITGTSSQAQFPDIASYVDWLYATNPKAVSGPVRLLQNSLWGRRENPSRKSRLYPASGAHCQTFHSFSGRRRSPSRSSEHPELVRRHT